MQKVQIAAPGGYDRLKVITSPDLQPGPGQVRIAVNAAGVNYADCVARMGLYASAKKYEGWPLTPGFEVAGTVDALGPNVTDLALGERVIALVRFGGYASQVVAPRAQVLRFPQAWSDTEAAGFAVAFFTAWFGLEHLARVRPGEAVLVHSAAGGVGQALVQLAKANGAKVFGVVRGSHKLEPLQALGCDGLCDKATTDWVKAAQVFAPGGFAVALDANGVETLGDSYRLLAPAGRLVVYGFATMLQRGGQGRPNWLRLAWSWLRTPRFNPLDLTTQNKSLLAFNLSFLFDRADLLAEAVERLWPLAASGQLLPVPTRSYGLADVAEAHRALESGQTAGKLVLAMR